MLDQHQAYLKYYQRLYERWRDLNETSSLADIADTALDMAVHELGYQRSLMFIQDDRSGLFKAQYHKGYTKPEDVSRIYVAQVLLSGNVVQALRDRNAAVVHHPDAPALAVAPLLSQLGLEEGVLSLFGGSQDVPFGLMVFGNTTPNNRVLNDPDALIALNNLMVHLCNAVNSSVFYQAWEAEKKHLQNNINTRTQEIRQQKEQFEAIFKTSKDGIAILDVHTSAFLNANPAFLDMTQMSLVVLQRHSLLSLTDSKNQALTSQALEVAKSKGYVKGVIVHLSVPSKLETIATDMSLALMHDGQHVLVSAKDISHRYALEREVMAAKNKAELAQAELASKNKALIDLTSTLEDKVLQRTRELEDALKQANEATIAKSQFLATMSHEIRTPLNGVLGMSELLLHSPLTEEQQQLLRMIQSSGNTLSSLVSDILDFSKIEAGKLELEEIEFDLIDFLEDVRNTFTIQAHARGIDLLFNLDPLLPQYTKGDPVRLRQIFSNLLSNAIKFTHEGLVSVDVSLDEEKTELRAAIKDTGIGISSTDQSKLFTAFSQANSSTTRKYGGTGLGLVISAMLVQLMKGRIWLHSQLGQGSEFCFTVKVALIDRPSNEQQSPVKNRLDLHHLRVLLVEDHQINRLLVTKFLQKMQVTPDIALDGLEAVAKAEAHLFDVVLMDIQMPHMDGITATKKIRTMPHIQQPYIIALTANAYDEDKQNCIEAGMDDFLSKPLSLSHLENALKRASQLQHKQA